MSKLFIGTMSKNIVDVIIENDFPIGFIPYTFINEKINTVRCYIIELIKNELKSRIELILKTIEASK